MQHCIESIQYLDEMKCYMLNHKLCLHNQEMINFINFSTENDHVSLFIRVRIESCFPLKNPITYLIKFIKSLFKSLALEFILWITEKREVLSANNLGFEVKPSDKLLI